MKKSKRRNKQNRLTITALALLLAIGVVGGTWAWFTDSAEFENKFQTGNYSDTIEEKFTPPTDWAPGDTTEKKVTVTNTGDVPLVVRVKFTEEWKKEGVSEILNSFQLADKSGYEAAAIKNFNPDVVFDTMDGTTIVGIESAFEDKWFIVTAEDKNGVRYPVEAYYVGVLNEKEFTSELLSSVTMNPNIPTSSTSTMVAKYKIKSAYKDKGLDEYVTFDETKVTEDVTEEIWLNTELKFTDDGVEKVKTIRDLYDLDTRSYTTTTGSDYAGAEYSLKITAETVQANEEAIDDLWGKTFGDKGTTALTESQYNSLISQFKKCEGFKSK